MFDTERVGISKFGSRCAKLDFTILPASDSIFLIVSASRFLSTTRVFVFRGLFIATFFFVVFFFFAITRSYSFG